MQSQYPQRFIRNSFTYAILLGTLVILAILVSCNMLDSGLDLLRHQITDPLEQTHGNSRQNDKGVNPSNPNPGDGDPGLGQRRRCTAGRRRVAHENTRNAVRTFGRAVVTSMLNR